MSKLPTSNVANTCVIVYVNCNIIRLIIFDKFKDKNVELKILSGFKNKISDYFLIFLIILYRFCSVPLFGYNFFWAYCFILPVEGLANRF